MTVNDSGTQRGTQKRTHRPTARIDADDAGRGLGRLVVALLEIVRQLIERQAIRRVDSGRLDADQIERLGQALLSLETKFAELRQVLDVDKDEALPIDVGDFLDNRAETPYPERKYDR